MAKGYMSQQGRGITPPIEQIAATAPGAPAASGGGDFWRKFFMGTGGGDTGMPYQPGFGHALAQAPMTLGDNFARAYGVQTPKRDDISEKMFERWMMQQKMNMDEKPDDLALMKEARIRATTQLGGASMIGLRGSAQKKFQGAVLQQYNLLRKRYGMKAVKDVPDEETLAPTMDTNEEDYSNIVNF